MVQDKIREQQQSGFMRETASDPNSNFREDGKAPRSPQASDRLQRKLYRQNKRLERWAVEEDIDLTVLRGSLGSRMSDEVFQEGSATPRAEMPAKNCLTSALLQQSGGTPGNDSIVYQGTIQRTTTPVCAKFLQAVSSGKPASGQVPDSHLSEPLEFKPMDLRRRRESLQSDGAALRSAVRSALSSGYKTVECALQSNSCTRCPSPKGNYQPSGSVTSSTSNDTTSYCSSTSEGKPWRRIRRLSNASHLVLHPHAAPAACHRKQPPVSPDRLYIQSGVHIGRARQLELRNAMF